MHKSATKIAFLTSHDRWSYWLQHATELLREMHDVSSISHCFLVGTFGSKGGIFRKLCSMPLNYLERRAYNPAEIGALSESECSKPVSVGIRNEESLVLWLELYQPDILICEGDVPQNVAQLVRQNSNARIWSINETWSDGIPAMAARQFLSRSGSVALSLSDISNVRNEYILTKTVSQVSEISLSHSIHRHFLKLSNMIGRALSAQNCDHISEIDKVSPLSNIEIISVAATQAYRRVIQRVQKRNDQAWSIALGSKADTESDFPDIASMTLLSPPSDRFWADPFLAEDMGRNYLFFEELKYGENIGKLAVAEVGPEGLRSKPEIILDEPWHLSYPQIFRHDGQWYMIPESGDAERVDLYTTEDFPRNWKRLKTLVKGQRFFDATVVEHDGLWWLFGTVAENGVSDYDELCVYYSNDLLTGDWTPHPSNPVISDVTSARPAGPFLWSSGRLFRPSQDSRKRYGYGLVLNEVIDLTTTNYKEKVTDRVLPERHGMKFRGMHTYGKNNGLVTVDCIL